MSDINSTVLKNHCYNITDNNLNPEMVNTVKENLKFFNNRQVLQAKAARQFQETAGLTTVSLLRMLDSNVLKNYPINREAVKNSTKIWDPSVANMKGKTTRSSTEPVVVDGETIHPVPPENM